MSASDNQWLLLHLLFFGIPLQCCERSVLSHFCIHSKPTIKKMRESITIYEYIILVFYIVIHISPPAILSPFFGHPFYSVAWLTEPTDSYHPHLCSQNWIAVKLFVSSSQEIAIWMPSVVHWTLELAVCVKFLNNSSTFFSINYLKKRKEKSHLLVFSRNFLFTIYRTSNFRLSRPAALKRDCRFCRPGGIFFSVRNVPTGKL